MEEVFMLVRCWLPSYPAQEQVWSQNRAEEEFDWHVEQIKQAGAQVSPVKRSMRTDKDEDGRDRMVVYRQRVLVNASEDVIQQLKQRFNRN